MLSRTVKVVIVCSVLVCLGISFKPVFSRGIVPSTSNAADAKKGSETNTPQVAPEPAPALPGSSGYDFSDSSHWNLTVSAWECMARKDYDGAFAYAKKCLEIYEPKAKEMAAGQKSFSRPGHEDDFALVNDVATSHYVMGETYMKLGKTDDALKEFKYVIDNYPYAQCWDPKGWFWKVAEVSRKNIDKIGKRSPEVSQ
jgi:tetratricopeptide (TPR) repeat protein